MVADGDVVFGQGLEAAVVVHVLPDLGGLVPGNALGELFAAQESLEDIIRAAAGGGAAGGFEKLLAQGSAAEAVDGLQLLQEGISLLEEGVEVGFHDVMYLYRYITERRKAVQLVFLSWVTQRSHTRTVESLSNRIALVSLPKLTSKVEAP